VIISTPENFRPPVHEWNQKKGEYLLTYDYVFVWANGRKKLTVPAGYNYDKASVPWWARGVARPDGPWDAASLFHDRLYQYRGKLPKGEYQVRIGDTWYDDPSPWTRKQADEFLEYVGILGGEVPWKAKLYKWAVKVYPVNWFKSF
jgi:hypothetical protein